MVEACPKISLRSVFLVNLWLSQAEGLNIPRVTLETQPRAVLSNSSGFGGSNVVAAFGLAS